ncbi:hypothetical protein JVU11DRAFT_4034 [Chiua virens]|nr:hypothetical protein JVU11DRAFT_4034 [Chiua virens]
MGNPRVWLITGASSGLGRSLTEYILKQGDIVVATLRRPEVLDGLVTSYPPDRLLVLQVDVTNPADIDRAFARTKEVFGRLDVVFNNAGYGIFGEAEMIPIKDARAMFEVNFWGAILVSRAAIQFFREGNEQGRGGGVLLQNSSITGFAGVPGSSYYGASKHALEGFSKSLAKELLPQWNIKICIIQTGGFDTKAIANTTYFPEHPVYRDEASMFTNFRRMVTTLGFRFEGDPIKFAKAIFALIKGGNIPLHLPIGQDALMYAKDRAELWEKDISGAMPWSTDLMRAKL